MPRLAITVPALFVALCVPALAVEDPWTPGCDGCSVIDAPAYMAEAIAAFEAAANEAGLSEGLSGPACRGLGGNGGDWSVCRFAQSSGCGSLDIAGQYGAVSVIKLGAFIVPARGCGAEAAHAFERVAVDALLKCRFANGEANSAEMLLTRAIDVSTPEKQAAFDAAHPSSEPLPADLDIAETCILMGGARWIGPAEGGVTEMITLYVREPQ